MSLDDYGMGQSSLRRLYDVPFEHLKIDMNFVARAVEDAKARSIIQSSVELGHTLGLTVCAEGIENAETLKVMRECGCDCVQGFGLCRPCTAEIIALQYALPDPSEGRHGDHGKAWTDGSCGHNKAEAKTSFA